MDSVKLRQKVILQSPPSGAGTRGQESGSWTNEATRRAEVKQLNGREQEAANKLYAEADWKVTVRYETGITPVENWRISWGSKTLSIGRIDNREQKNRFWDFYCSEVSNG